MQRSLKFSQPKKTPRPDGFSTESYNTFKVELIPILFKLCHKIETRGTSPNLFCDAKPYEDTTNKITG